MIKFNVYCDESCHLENDHQKSMVLGAVWCPVERTKEISKRIREFKKKHGLKADFEIKWVKVSPAQQGFYEDLINYFYDVDDLHFRALIINDKAKLKHSQFNQNHDDWYYKMYFFMLKTILIPSSSYRIYLDIKDTCSAEKVKKLGQVLRNNLFDMFSNIIERVQTVRSHEIEILQLADLLIGAISYVSRDLNTSSAKLKLIESIKKRSGYSLKTSTLPREDKTNLFYWDAREVIL